MQKEEKLHALNIMRLAVNDAANKVAIQHLAYHWSNRLDTHISRLRGMLAVIEDILKVEMDKTEKLGG